MDTEFQCPVCFESRWQRAGSARFSASELDGELPPADRLRRRLLFEVWFPDRDEVCLEVRYCLVCGFLTYAPRPSGADIDAKYRWLHDVGIDPGWSDSSPSAQARDRQRAERIRRQVEPWLRGDGRRRVLDVGGGDGNLLSPLVEMNADCAVVDYNRNSRPGVEWLGTKLEDLGPDEKFDVMICSHVLEHVASPRDLVAQIKAHLADDGVVYAEVPQEIWKGTPIVYNPATHINFFTLASFRELFERSGLRVVDAHEGKGVYGDFDLEVASVLAVAPRENDAPAGRDPAGETAGRLQPTLSMELKRAWRMRRVPPLRAVVRRVVPRRSD